MTFSISLGLIAVVALLFFKFLLPALESMENERVRVEREQQEEQERERKRAEEKIRETVAERQRQWKRDAPKREAEQREQARLAEAERISIARWRIEMAEAEIAGEDVCYNCLTINPSRCSSCGACTAGCSHSCPSDD